MDDKKSKVDLNIYLLKSGLTEYSKSIKETDKLKSEEIPLNGKNIGMLYIKQSHANLPKWTKFFDGVVSPKKFGINSSTGALLALEVEGRFFMLAFGQGRHLLNSEFIEMNFGFRVALNCVNENSLRSIDKVSFEAHPRQSREQSGKATELQYFMVDVERDLLRAVTGVPTDPYFGERISGMDAVKLSLDIDLSGLKGLLSRLLKEYQSNAYKKKGFAFVDHIGEVKDSILSDALDLELISKIKSSNLDKVWLSVPELVDWGQAVGFKYSLANNWPRVSDVRISDFMETLGEKKLDKAILMRRKIFCVDADDIPVVERPAYYYIYAEHTYQGKTYLLNNGKWYLVDLDFVTQINEYYNNVPRYSKALPIFEHEDKTEERYNKRVAKNNVQEFALLDRDNVHLPGAVSPVEPCDLYRRPREFIHVKRYGGSSLLSHLFNQGLVSGELFKMDKVFRELLNEKLPNSHKIQYVDTQPKQNEYKIVYAIISEYGEDLSIPFFSKITLHHAVNRLTAIGFKVEIAKIAVSDSAKKTKIYPPAHPKTKKPKKTLTPA